MSKAMILKPHMSEKAYLISQTQNAYVFEVPADANKLTVARAVSQQYDVTVIDVNILVAKGKPKRTVRKGGRPTNSKRSDAKRAYVFLKSGDSLPVFAAEEQPASEPPKTSKKEKK